MDRIQYPVFFPKHTKHAFEKARITALLSSYSEKHGRFPGTKEIESAVGVNAKTIQRHGGLERFYDIFGISYIDRRRGEIRARVALNAVKRSESVENTMYETLKAKFGERNVHKQSPYSNTLHRSDFKVYREGSSPFFVDVFYPADMYSFSGCINIKLRKIPNVDNNIFFVSMNEEYITPHSIKEYLAAKKNPVPQNVCICTASQFLEALG